MQDEASDRFRAWRTRREPRIPKPPGPVCPLWGDPTKNMEKNTGKKPGTMGTRRKNNGKTRGKFKRLRTQDLGEVQGGFFVLTVAKIMTFVGLCGGLHYSVILHRF